MPDQFDRHARPNEWGDHWGPLPSRSQQRRMAASDDPVTPVRKAKRGPEHCPGSPDKWHHGEIIFVPPHAFRKKPAPETVCEWRPRYYRNGNLEGDNQMVRWECFHQRVCTYCSKILDKGVGTRCPLYPGIPEDKQAAVQAFLEQEQRQEERWHYRRQKVINGRQGYRKPKAK